MKTLTKLTVLSAAALFGGLASEASAQDRSTLSSRAGGNARALLFDSVARNKVPWRRQVTTRALNDTFVYRHEGRATARDEESSPVMIFHSTGGSRVKGGHVYQRRAK